MAWVRSRSFSFKISLILMIIIFFSLLLNSFLNFFNFEKTYKDLICSRFIVAGRDIKSTIEYQLNLGLSLNELKSIQPLISEIKSKDQGLSSIYVFDENGAILFCTDARRTGTRAEKSILSKIKSIPAAKSGDDEKPLTVMERGTGIIILPVTNSFNRYAGSIALEYPARIVSSPVNRILASLSATFIILFILFSLLTLLIIKIISKNISTGFILMRNSLDNLISGRPGGYTPPGKNRRMEEVFSGFCDTSEKTIKEIDAIASEIDSI